MQLVTMQEVETAIDKYGKIVLSKNDKNNIIIMSMEEYMNKSLENNITEKLIKAEEQIEKGETVNGATVFKELEEKYEF